MLRSRYTLRQIGLEYFTFKLPCNDAQGLLVVADLEGNTMFSIILNSSATFTTVNSNGWSDGVYLYRLTCSNKVIRTGKFEVIK